MTRHGCHFAETRLVLFLCFAGLLKQKGILQYPQLYNPLRLFSLGWSSLFQQMLHRIHRLDAYDKRASWYYYIYIYILVLFPILVLYIPRIMPPQQTSVLHSFARVTCFTHVSVQDCSCTLSSRLRRHITCLACR